jgi:hypothetical protein
MLWPASETLSWAPPSGFTKTAMPFEKRVAGMARRLKV